MDKKNEDEARKGARHYKSKSRTIKSCEWPGTGKPVGLLKLNCAELQQARFAAIEHFDKKNIELTIFSASALDAEEMVQQCYLFLIDPEANNPKYRIFSSADEARSELDDDERVYFCRKYNAIYNVK